jgi:hypothetical protein
MKYSNATARLRMDVRQSPALIAGVAGGKPARRGREIPKE